jgi:transcriptional regulator with XRE-family HTH domain
MAGRRRSPLTGSGIPVELAQRLRNLRDASGLTLRQLAAKSGYSSGALSQAESGRTVPSWDMVTAFVQTCGGDPAQWCQLWELADAERPEPSAPSEPEPSKPPLPTLDIDAAVPVEQVRRRWNRPVTAVAVAAAVVVLSGAAAWMAGGQPPRAPANTAAPARVIDAARDNTDPYADGCKADEEQLNWQPVYRRGGRVFGSILLMYSPACQAAWGYLEAPNSSAWTIHIITHRIPGPVIQWQFSGDVPYGSWGNVLSTRHGCVYTEAYVVDKSGEGPHARTACIQPTPPPRTPGP